MFAFWDNPDRWVSECVFVDACVERAVCICGAQCLLLSFPLRTPCHSEIYYLNNQFPCAFCTHSKISAQISGFVVVVYFSLGKNVKKFYEAIKIAMCSSNSPATIHSHRVHHFFDTFVFFCVCVFFYRCAIPSIMRLPSHWFHHRHCIGMCVCARSWWWWCWQQ